MLLNFPDEGKEPDWKATIDGFRERELRKAATNPQMKEVLAMGASVIFRYSTVADGMVGEFTITTDDLSNATTTSD